MRPIFHLLTLAVLALPVHAGGELPAGEYVLVDPIPPGPPEARPAAYTHLTLTDGHMEFRFISPFVPDAVLCEQEQKCEQAANALGLDYVLEGDRIVVTDHQIRTGPGMLIEDRETDLPLIVRPILQLVDGARVGTAENEITFLPPDGPDARFLAGSVEDARKAMAFARYFEVSLRYLDRCVLRQVGEVRLRDEAEQSEAGRNLLAAVEAAGMLSDVAQAAGYWSATPDAPEADSPEVRRLKVAAGYLRFLSLAVGQYPDLPPEQALAAMLELLSEGDSFDAGIVAAYVTPNRDGLVQLGRYNARFANLLAEGEDPAGALCRMLPETAP